MDIFSTTNTRASHPSRPCIPEFHKKFSQRNALSLMTLMCSGALLTACGGSSSNAEPTPPTVNEESSPQTVEFAEAQSNPYYPIASGLVYTYKIAEEEDEVDDGEDNIEQGSVEEDSENNDGEAEAGDTFVEVHYTTQTQQVDGINAVAVIEKSYEDAELKASSTQWVAMDVDGTVWILKENRTSYEDAEIDEESSWTAGINGARRGIRMPDTFSLGDSFVIQYLSEEESESGLVMSLSESVSLDDLGDYREVLHLVETSEDEDSTEIKNTYYAPDIGLVRYMEDDDTIYTLSSVRSIVEHSIEEDETMVPIASDEYGEFDDAGFVVEYTEDELQMSVAIKVEMEDTPLETLKIWGPEGNLQATFEAEQLEDLGASELFIETAEGIPSFISDQLHEGTYIFLAETTNDEEIFGQAVLSFDRLDASSIDLCGNTIDVTNAVVSWSLVDEAESYTIEISAEDEDIDLSLLIEASSTTSRFTIPESLLESEAIYSIEVGVENEAGNITVAKCKFSTN